MLSDHKISIFISVCGKMMVCCYFTLLHLWCSSSPHPMLSTVSVHLWMLSLVTPAVHANRYIVPFVGVIEAPGSVFLSQLKSDLWLWLVAILGWHFVDEAPSRRKRPVAAGHPVCPKHKSSSQPSRTNSSAALTDSYYTNSLIIQVSVYSVCQSWCGDWFKHKVCFNMLC